MLMKKDIAAIVTDSDRRVAKSFSGRPFLSTCQLSNLALLKFSPLENITITALEYE